LERGANPEVEPLVTKGGEAALHVEGHAHRAHGVLLRVGAPGCAEEDHDAVAFEVVDRRSMGLGALGHLLEVVIEDEREVLGIEFVGEFGEALDVGEEDRELDAVDPEPVLSVPTVQSIGDGRGDVAADEGVGDPEPFLLETLARTTRFVATNVKPKKPTSGVKTRVTKPSEFWSSMPRPTRPGAYSIAPTSVRTTMVVTNAPK
jgi:hypothetical protein